MPYNKASSGQTFSYSEGNIAEKMDYAFVINRQLDRINLIASYPSDNKGSDLATAIDIMDAMLEPYKDDIFIEEEKGLMDKIDKRMSGFSNEDKSNAWSEMELEASKQRLRYLVKLMSRKGFIPASRITATDE